MIASVGAGEHQGNGAAEEQPGGIRLLGLPIPAAVSAVARLPYKSPTLAKDLATGSPPTKFNLDPKTTHRSQPCTQIGASPYGVFPWNGLTYLEE